MNNVQEQIEKLQKELRVCIDELNVKLNSPSFAAERTTAMVNIAKTILLLKELTGETVTLKSEEVKVDNRKKSK